VLAGEGRVDVTIDGKPAPSLDVGGTPRSYELVSADRSGEGVIEVTVPAGVQAYSFTFG